MFGRIMGLGLRLQYKDKNHCQQATHNSHKVIMGFNSLNNKKRKYTLAYHQHDKLSVSVNQVINIGRNIPISNIALHVSQEEAHARHEESEKVRNSSKSHGKIVNVPDSSANEVSFSMRGGGASQ